MYKYLLLHLFILLQQTNVCFNGDGSSLLEKEEIVDISIYQYTNNYTKSIMNYYYHYHRAQSATARFRFYDFTYYGNR